MGQAARRGLGQTVGGGAGGGGLEGGRDGRLRRDT